MRRKPAPGAPSAALPLLAAGLLGASWAGGCRQAGYTRVDEGVYVARAVPGLERAGEQISTARREARGGAAPAAPLPELSVVVDPSTGLGPESFRIRVEEKSIRVEGGGPAGAFYGGLEVARRIREGRAPSTLALERAEPLLPLRLARVGAGLPGLSAEPRAADWKEVLDRLAAARFNVLVARCGQVFPALVRLARFPKAFEGADGDAEGRRAAFRELLAAAEERNLRLVLVLEDSRPPAAFQKHYGVSAADAATMASLEHAYLRECIAELLRAFPRLRGVGPARGALEGLRRPEAEELLGAGFAEGLKTSGGKATLYIEAEADAVLSGASFPAGVEVLREVSLPLVVSQTGGEERGARAAPGLVARFPREVLAPAWPEPSWCQQVSRSCRAAAFGGIAVNVFPRLSSGAAAGAPRPDFERESLFAACLGLSSFEPGLEEGGWALLWRDAAKDRADALRAASAALAGAWPELARFRGGPAWSPLTGRETGSGEGEIRDADPFLSVVELALSRCADPRYATVLEAVAYERAGSPAGPERVLPLAVADGLLSRAGECRARLGTGSPGVPPPIAGFADLAAVEIGALSDLVEHHGRRIRAAVHLLRHAAGLGGAREAALGEAQRAVECWRRAASGAALLREGPLAGIFPDLGRLAAAVEADLRLVASVKTDPIGFQAAATFSGAAAGRLPADFDFRSLRGVLDLGASVLDVPPAGLLEESQHFEAEDFHGAWARRAEVAGFSGEGYVSSGASGKPAALPMRLRLRAEKPGTVHVWVRALAGGGS
ncbi:MAG: hypothetical protein HY721_35060, partial [Planctomycetes bacterium]|nr:hypothetical protein [Planctomycetota bacterium]